MPSPSPDDGKSPQDKAMKLQRQLAMGAGLFQADVTVRTLLESLAEGVIVVDQSGTIILVNASAEQMFGYPSEEIIGRPHAILIPERFRPIHEEHQSRFFAAPIPRRMGPVLDLAGLRRDGSEFALELTLGALETTTGLLVLALVNDVTDRKQAEEVLRLSEARFRVLYHDNPTMIVTIDTEWNMLMVNPACAHQLGYEVNELEGESVLKLFQENEHLGLIERLRLCFENPDQVYHWQLRKIRKDGGILYVDETAKAIRNLDGSLNILLVCPDITERKRAEQEREQLLLQLDSVLESINEGVVIADLDGNVMTMNREALDLNEFKNIEEVPRPFSEFQDLFELFDLEGRPVPFEQWPLMRAIRGERFCEYEVQVRRKDTGHQWIRSFNGTPVLNKTGKPILAVDSVRDITEKKRLQEELRITKAQLQLITDNMPVGVVQCNREGRYLWVSPAFAQWLGRRPEEITGKLVAEVIGNEAYEIIRPYIERVLAGERVHYEARLNYGNLGHRWVSATYMPTDGPAAYLNGWVAVISDITERKKLEEELQQSKERLEQRVAQRTAELSSTITTLKAETQRRLQALEELRDKEQMLIQQSRMAAMGEMIGFIAHQWRQPLNTLGLIVQELPLYFQSGNFTSDYLDAVTDKARELITHMSRTVDDFRSFFQPEEHKVRFLLKDVLAQTLKLVSASFSEQQMGLDVSVEDDVGLEGYPNEYSQVILNILINARDAFLERNVAHPRIMIRIFTKENRSVMCITDNAGGIAEEALGRIFDPYFTTKAPDKGTGLGLYMAKIIIEKHMGGRVSVRNAEQGAEFRIEV